MREDWNYKLLGDIGKVSMCKRIYKNQTSSSGEIPFYKIGTFGKEPDAFISKDLYMEYRSKFSYPRKGDVLLSASGTIGRRVVYNGEPAYFQDSNIVWIANDETEVLNDYLYAFYGFCNWNPSKGATISRLYNNDLRKIEIPIPPLPEQKQIVVMLDEAFEAIDQAKANIERNIENTKELFQSKLNEIFSQRGEGWDEKAIDEITKVINGYAFKSGDFSSENPVKAIKITNVGVQEFVNDTGNYLPKSFIDTYSKVKVVQGDIVIALTRTIISSGLKVARVPETYDGALVNQRVAALSANRDIINPTYLYYFLSTDIVYNYVLSHVNTLMQPNLSIKDLKSLKVPICSVSKQKEIILVIDSFWDKLNKLNYVYQEEHRNIEELKKSILQKAFSGELTANEHVAA